jgi:hypothetical protein
MTLAEFKNLNKQNGFHWFDKDTMRFFKTKIELWDCCSEYFVTSEINPDGVKAYTLRRANHKTGQVSTVGTFHGFKTKAQAWKYRLEVGTE